MIGVDIYDCVVVINSEQALEAFYKIRCTLGSEISVSAGPVGAGGVLETELHKRQSPIFTYMKSRGFYAGVQIDGTVIIERGDENEVSSGFNWELCSSACRDSMANDCQSRISSMATSDILHSRSDDCLRPSKQRKETTTIIQYFPLSRRQVTSRSRTARSSACRTRRILIPMVCLRSRKKACV